MPSFICVTCGTGFPPSDREPANCPICEDERQYVPLAGQQWTAMETIGRRHMNAFRRLEDGLLGLAMAPVFAIGQRALILRTSIGNILWECVPLLDQATIDIVNGLGGLAAIAVSHPHYYSTMVDWSHAFNAPVHLHEADQHWVMRPDPTIHFWKGETLALADGVTLVHCGGHFAGGTVLHWSHGGAGRGALATGDIAQVAADHKHVAFMRSYPNYLPLSAPSVERIGRALEPFAFEVIYGAFFERDIKTDGKGAVRRSVARYIKAVRDDGSADRQ